MIGPARLTFALAFVAVTGGFLLVPGTAERLTMLVRDGRFETAIELGDEAVRAGDDAPETLARLFDVNSHQGDPARARLAILDYLAQRPHDAAMLRRAVEFFEEGKDLGTLKTTLGALIAETKDPAAVEKLARIHRLYGEFAEERALLLQADASAALTPDMAWRAVGLLAKDGDFAKAAEIARRFDDGAGDARSANRALLFEVLLRSGQPAEAVTRATRWADAGLDIGQQTLFVLQLALAGADREALALAGVRHPGGGDPSALAWTLGERGHVALAEAIIDDWMRAADEKTTRKAMRLYVDLTLSTGTVARAVSRVQRLVRSPDPAARRQSVQLAATLYERQGYGPIAPVRPFLTGDMLMSEPLFAADLSQAEKNPVATRLFLLSCDLARLDEEDAARWTRLASDNLRPGEVLDTLTRRWRQDRLSPALLPGLQAAAIRSGRFDPSWTIIGARAAAKPGGDPQS